MNTVTVTHENITAFFPYQDTLKKLTIGEVLQVVSSKIPNVRTNGYFVIVTDWQPNDNSLRMIARENDPAAIEYGWQPVAQITREGVANKKDIRFFNRYSIPSNYIK